jgi:hypothetical protein
MLTVWRGLNSVSRVREEFMADAVTLESARARAKQIAAGTSLDERGRAQIEEGLALLYASLEEEAPDLKPGAMEGLLARVDRRVDLLQQIVSDRRRFPEIAAVEIKRPLFITGLPRSGTTILHSVLAQDPDSRSPLTWEVSYPSPPPSADTFETDPRIEAWNRENLKPGAQRADPEFQKKHLTGAQLPEECTKMMASSQRWSDMESAARVRSFMGWWFDADHRWDYEVHRQWLQHLQWRNARERWVLKTPRHIFFLPALLEVYPDACIVQTHRDPAQVVSSVSSLIYTIRKRAFADIDMKALGQEMLHLWSEGVARSIAFRNDHPNVKVVDVSHKQVVTDPISAVRTIYQAFDLPLPDSTVEAMGQFVADNPREAFGAHTHTLADYGLTREQVYDRMQDYVANFSEYF